MHYVDVWQGQTCLSLFGRLCDWWQNADRPGLDRRTLLIGRNGFQPSSNLTLRISNYRVLDVTLTIQAWLGRLRLYRSILLTLTGKYN